MNKEKWVAVTDEAEADELKAKRGDLDTPICWSPNGHLWARAEELEAWRESREHS
ncbi:MAG TPA: hypothetical protein VNH83_08705 [Bryobacteraceae bacterium]|nr:hypothetical protein [Bryobacteraceae bacterium]